MPARFGVEEEFVLLDEETLVPLSMRDGSRERITGHSSGGEVMPEYLTCQFECVTEPASTRADASAQLSRMRQLIGTHAAQQRAVAAPSATPFISPGGLVVSPSEHYAEVATQLAEITREHEVNGLHVHVEVDGDEERVRALNRVRGWLPALLALTGNGPFAHGRHTGFASWRSILIRRLPSSWCPPHFRDLDDYRARVDRLIALGAIPDAGSLAWAVRLSEHYPTVEVRVFDAQLTPEDALFAATLSRALIVSDPPPSARDEELDAIDASLWIAARRGPEARVIDPSTGEVAPLWEVAATMLAHAAPALAEYGDEEFAAGHLERIRVEGTGAQRQERAYERDGIAGLRSLYRAGTTAA
ncbi:YbdK family carboxylate-amine ligase [Microbacterium sp. SD291]|uniref:carboxylate-amine ligase n=1 Tax=Microbacterium sp. SD291 TaxID=2782007 RepID=UPI001A97BA78|nr:YbdK family carboxylate-amine ligase [Microbacterium sp. SD291]MBO0980797.1 YbdK family carboxylate-amine ligase [Microbacterium sp. SD291]